jgi:hypothetical protein
MADVRDCDQCGARFTPRREHARFCSARCRVAWNRAERAHPEAEASTLTWAMAAMADTVARLPRTAGLDRPRAFALITEAVWWVTIVDANLVRYHPDVYDSELAGRPAAERLRIEETLGGLRFVRNQVGNDIDKGQFIQPDAGPAPGGRHKDWLWASLPEPTNASLSPRGLEWELERYRAYECRLAGRAVVSTFSCVASFLNPMAEGITAPADAGRAGS